MRTITTAHFKVHYPVPLDSLARRAATEAELAWRNLSTQLDPPSAPVELLLADNVDLSNGFAGTFPSNRITIYVLPPVMLAELRFHDDWLQLVITHELAHVFHIDRARGLWRVGRTLLGRNPILFPNALLPSWVKEGLAVHFESDFTGSGRIVSTAFPAVESAAARARDIPDLGEWSASTTRYPGGQIAYAWGSVLMHREAQHGGVGSMRKFVNETATFPIPFFVNRAAKKSFGESFSTSFAGLRDSLVASIASAPANDDGRWQRVVPHSELGLRNAAFPRWRAADTVEWVASNGREVTALYRAAVPRFGTPDSALATPQRVARRNTLDVNAPVANGGSVYSQYDFTNAYTIRSDLYASDERGDRRITHGARLVQPDARATDGAIVAVQLRPGNTRLVRVSDSGIVTELTREVGALWAEPRWSPNGGQLAAVQLLPTGVQRIVLIDTLGTLTRIVAESRAVLATPAFTPDGLRLVWTSDRSGTTAIETASIAAAHNAAVRDTAWRAEAHVASRVSNGVFQPSVSPDGQRVAALLYRTYGFVLAVAPLDTTGPLAVDGWYEKPALVRAANVPYAGLSTPYHALRQLLPTYWQPVVGEARDGGSNYGAYTSGEDIIGRHSYSASALVNPRSSEFDGDATYRYAGLGMPIIAASVSQSWNATFRIVDSTQNTLGFIGRRVQLATLALNWSVPHVRWSASYGFGAQYERRAFATDTDSLLGAPGSLLRTGTHYPSVFVTGSFGTLSRGAQAFSAEQGVSASGTVSLRKREGAANTESWRGVGVMRVFQPLPLPGFARHVLGARVAVGVTDTHAGSEFSVGGVSGVLTEVVPGVSVGDPSRVFPVRGFTSGAARGIRALSGTFEYRAPLALIGRGAGLLPLFLDNVSINAFGDAARAWCPGAAAQRVPSLCNGSRARDGWLASAGAELNVDLAVQYDVPYRLRLGVAKPMTAPLSVSRKPSFYVTLGAFF